MIKTMINEHVEVIKKIKAKEKELDGIRLEIEDINNVDLFDTTFEIFTKRAPLRQYLNTQIDRLANFKNSSANTSRGNIGQRLAGVIKELVESDEGVTEAYSSYKEDLNNKYLEKTYDTVFNNKLEELHQYTLEQLEEYSEITGEGQYVRNTLKMYLPTPRRI